MIELREIAPPDREQLYQWRRAPEVDRWLYSLPPADPDHHARWFDRFMADPDQTGWIITSDGGAPCGFLQLKGLTSAQKRAEYHWYIGEAEARGRGAGRAAQALGLDRAFSRYDVQKVWSEVRADNDAALKAQAAAGFRREGYLRRHALKGGAYHDVVLLAILVEEWRAGRDKVIANLTESGLIRAV